MSIDRDAAAATAPTPESNFEPGRARVLDVGCGAGDSLNEELQLRRGQHPGTNPTEMVGVDVDEESLALGKKNYPDFVFICARGEQLPFPDQSFDTVISRVAIPYMDIPVVLREMRRVLKPGGELKIKLHPLSFTLSELKAGLRTGPFLKRLQNLVYRLYVIANGIALHLAGVNFRFPLARRRCESFQTRAGIRRALVAARLVQIDTSCWDTRIFWPHAGNCRAFARRDR